MLDPNNLPPLIIGGGLLVACIVLLYLWVRAENRLKAINRNQND